MLMTLGSLPGSSTAPGAIATGYLRPGGETEIYGANWRASLAAVGQQGAAWTPNYDRSSLRGANASRGSRCYAEMKPGEMGRPDCVDAHSGALLRLSTRFQAMQPPFFRYIGLTAGRRLCAMPGIEVILGNTGEL